MCIETIGKMIKARLERFIELELEFIEPSTSGNSTRFQKGK